MLSKEQASKYRRVIEAIRAGFDIYLSCWILKKEGISDQFCSSYIGDCFLDSSLQSLFKEQGYNCKVEYNDRDDSSKATLIVDLK